MWDYKFDDLVAYLYNVAPEMKSNAERAKENGMNEFLANFVGRQQETKRGQKIPQPKDTNERKGIAFDAWLLLGNGDDALCLEDISDYVEERIRSTEAKARENTERQSMGMSNIIYGMNADTQARENAELAGSVWERHERLHSDKRTMNEVLAGVPVKPAYNPPKTLVAEADFDPDSYAKNQFLRNQ